jgi:hypothetical protein
MKTLRARRYNLVVELLDCGTFGVLPPASAKTRLGLRYWKARKSQEGTWKKGYYEYFFPGEKHYEKPWDGMYESLLAGAMYDHSSPARRYGILSAMFVKEGARA